MKACIFIGAALIIVASLSISVVADFRPLTNNEMKGVLGGWTNYPCTEPITQGTACPTPPDSCTAIKPEDDWMCIGSAKQGDCTWVNRTCAEASPANCKQGVFWCNFRTYDVYECKLDATGKNCIPDWTKFIGSSGCPNTFTRAQTY